MPSPPTASPATPRLLSLDALRGFDMFWITGGDLAIRSLPKIYDCGISRELAAQMEHCEWAGFHFYDLIFPLFVFIVGVSIVFSVPRMIERGGYLTTIRRIIIRSIILFVLGIFYMGGVADSIQNMYFVGVLHRIAVAYFFTALIFCVFTYLSPSLAAPNPAPAGAGGSPPFIPGLLFPGVVCIALLIGYWALMTFIPVPGIGAPDLSVPAKNLAHHIDLLYMPGKKFEGTILSTMAAVANCLLGVLAGLLLINEKITAQKKVLWLLGGGLVSLALGFAWGMQFPIIKLLWTSSYVLVSCGYGAILLGLFYQIIEIWRFQKWAQPFIWIGMNAITLYITANVISLHRLSLRFVGGDIKNFLGNWADLASALVGIAIALWFVNFLYRRKIFLRL